MPVDTVHASLKLAPEVFNILGVYSANYKLLQAMINGLVLVASASKHSICTMLVTIDGGCLANILLDFRNQNAYTRAFNVLNPSPAATFNHTKNYLAVVGLCGAPSLWIGMHVGFVYFNVIIE